MVWLPVQNLHRKTKASFAICIQLSSLLSKPLEREAYLWKAVWRTRFLLHHRQSSKRSLPQHFAYYGLLQHHEDLNAQKMSVDAQLELPFILEAGQQLCIASNMYKFLHLSWRMYQALSLVFLTVAGSWPCTWANYGTRGWFFKASQSIVISQHDISVNCLTRFSSSVWSWMKYDFITRQLQSNRNHLSFGDNMKVMTVVDCVFDTPGENKLLQWFLLLERNRNY